jgi:pimeloyl-ACP methyl ester carboxylesterase
VLKKALLIAVVLVAGSMGILWIGAVTSLDWDRQHSKATAALPEFAPESNGLVRITAGTHTFRARVAGLGGKRGDLILLHGFPESSAMWIPLIEAAADRGYQVVAFDQRGYSPGARPDDVAEYSVEKLSADVLAVADAVDFAEFHLVGHDWGSAVGWGLVLTRPERILTWTSLSIPHIAAFGAAIANDSDQRRRSSYMLLFRTPWLPEQLFAFNNFRLMRSILYADHHQQQLDEYLALFSEPGAITAALNWYRAALAGALPSLQVTRPVLFIWGNQDPAVGRAGVDGQRPYLPDDYTELELDAGHWLMETHAELVVPAVLDHLQKHHAPPGEVRGQPTGDAKTEARYE